MKNKSNSHKLLSIFLKDPKNDNIKFDKLICKNKPDGFCIDVDSLNKEQIIFINNLPKD